jgi:hypothetical protein
VYIEGKLKLCRNSRHLEYKRVSLIEQLYKHCVMSRGLPLSCRVWSVRAVIICEFCGDSNFERSHCVSCRGYLASNKIYGF